MSTPVVICHELPGRGPSHASLASYGSSPAGSLPPFSPPSTFVYHGSLGVAGASPPYRGGSFAAGEKANPYLAAKKFWKRLCFDPALDPTEYTIGFIETVQQPERKSGVEAWSMRLHDRLCELPYSLFVERFCGIGVGGGVGGGEGAQTEPRYASPSGGAWLGSQTTSEEAGSDVPYHRIAYFKHGNAMVWESEYHKRRVSDLPAAIAAPHPHVAASDGGAGTPGGAAGDRSRRRTSRDGMPPMPPAIPGLLPFVSLSSLHRIHALGSSGPGSASGVSGRSPRGASPRGSDDGLDGASSDEEDVLLLEEEEDDDEEEGEEEEEERGREERGLLDGVGGCGCGAGAVAQVSEAPLPQLPEECWMAMLQQLGVRDVCMVARTCKWLRQAASDLSVWRCQHRALWGLPPDPQLGAAVVRRMCRRSQLRAARWLEAHVRGAAMGYVSTTCLQMDDSKVVSGDGSAVRLWSHVTGRRIATLQGHAARVTAVCFDDSLLVSGCLNGVVKVWSMDELRCRRTMRGHNGAIKACCLLPNGIPISGAEDATMRLWDVASGSSIVALEAGSVVLDLQPHAPSGHLVAAAGAGVQLWDVSTATLLHTLGDMAEDISVAGAARPHPYTCVSYMGDLLAAGRRGEVILLDPRVNSVVGRLRCDVTGDSSSGGADGAFAGGAFASSLGAIAAAAADGGGGAGGGGRAAPCVGVQMDEWKLVCGFNDGRHQLHVYDIRAIPKGQAPGTGGGSSPRRPWQVPLMTLTAPARINAFQFHEQALLAGLEGAECTMWRFENPNAAPSSPEGDLPAALAAAASWTRAAGPVGPSNVAAGPGGGGGGGLGAEGFADGAGGRKEKKKPAKVAKKQTRYPKRNTK